jgi:hypothetical protein
MESSVRISEQAKLSAALLNPAQRLLLEQIPDKQQVIFLTIMMNIAVPRRKDVLPWSDWSAIQKVAAEVLAEQSQSAAASAAAASAAAASPAVSADIREIYGQPVQAADSPVSAVTLQQAEADSKEVSEAAQAALREAGAAGVNLTEQQTCALLSRRAASVLPWFRPTDRWQHPKLMTPAERTLMFNKVGASITSNLWCQWQAAASKACNHAAIDCVRAAAVQRHVLRGDAFHSATQTAVQGGILAAGAL